MGVLQLEMDLLPVVVGMELNGFCVDRKKREEIVAKAQEREQLALTVYNLLGTREVNLNALAQLLEALQGLGIALKNTNEESLSECRHPVAAVYLGVQEMEEVQRGCRVSHPRNPARWPNSLPVLSAGNRYRAVLEF